MVLRVSTLSFLVCVVSAAAAVAPESAASQAEAALARLPLRFEANQGQWRPDVRYSARTGGGTVLLTSRGAVLASNRRRVEIALLHGNRAPRIEALDPMQARTNYFVGNRNQWRRDVANFTRVAYRSVYPGIDLVYYGNRDQLEYDFVLRPGADPRVIRLQFRGAEGVKMTAEGDLLVESAGAQMVQKRPAVYQEDPATAERQPVAAHYELLAGGMVRLRLAPYDPSRRLVIDPVVAYSVFIGGGSTDVVNAVATDPQGFIYVAGYTRNGDLQSYGNTVQAGYSAGTDGFVAKMDPTKFGAATWVYFTYLGGGRDDAVTAIYVDAAGNIYSTGTTTSSDFPWIGAAPQTTLALSSTSTSAVFPTDAFITVMNPTDGLLYSTYYGGSGNETPSGIGVDPAGHLYIAGTTTSADFPVSPNAAQNVLWGPSDIFVAVLDPNSTTPLYSTYLGGESNDDCRGMAITPNGLVYLAASTYSQSFPISGAAYRWTLQGFENIVIAVIDTNQQGPSSLIYSTYFGGSVLDEVRKLSVDANGKLLLTGWTASPDFPVTATAVQPAIGGPANAFVARVNPLAPPAAFLEYSTFLGGSVTDIAYDVQSDATGKIYVTGYTMSPNFPVTKDAFQPQYGNGADVFLTKLDPAVSGPGALLYSTFLGGVGTHVGKGIALAPNGSIFVAGYTTADWNLPAALNIFNGGGSDGFVVVLK